MKPEMSDGTVIEPHKVRVRWDFNLPTIGVVVLAAAGLGWQVNGYINEATASARALAVRMERLEKLDLENRLARLESDSENQKALLLRIDSKLDRVIERVTAK